MFHRLSFSSAFLGSVRAGILNEKLISIVNGMLAEPDGPLRSNLTRLGLAVYSRSAVPARDMRAQPTGVQDLRTVRSNLAAGSWQVLDPRPQS